jgi:hypothetical protein
LYAGIDEISTCGCEKYCYTADTYFVGFSHGFDSRLDAGKLGLDHWPDDYTNDDADDKGRIRLQNIHGSLNLAVLW